MRILRSPAELEPCRGGALVPTMGALHEGHLALVRHAAQLGHAPVTVSVFVNPTQFGPNDDLDRYPRSLEADVAAAEAAGADVVFAPDVTTMYPPDAPPLVPAIPAVATTPGLEDACRPGHFAGVCLVVGRLFDLLGPRFALFGEKDYQQILVVREMVRAGAPERWGDLEIVAHETIREADGLALSSRNAYLAAVERDRALGLFRAMEAGSAEGDPTAAEQAMANVLREHDLEVDYAVVRDAATLMPVESYDAPARALIAGRLGSVRLIDNRPMPGR